jgi:hypothetical protein
MLAVFLWVWLTVVLGRQQGSTGLGLVHTEVDGIFAFSSVAIGIASFITPLTV